jgi:tripartite-type tricarboxylate transporter receptor subunit TctC
MTANLPRRNRSLPWGLLLAVAVIGGCAVWPASAGAQSVEQFYRGRTLTLVVGTSPGGINDLSARIVARHIGRFIPGNPNVIVQDLPGGGGLVTANRLYNSAERDGSVLAKIERGVPQLAIQGNRNANFDPLKFTWLGSLSSYADDAYLMLVNSTYSAKTVADLKKPGPATAFGADNAASSNLVFGLIAKEVLGLNVKVIRGYTGAAPMFLAMQGGELDGQMIGLSSVRTGQRDLWNRHAFRPLLQFGRTTRLEELSDLPTGRELAPDPDSRALIEFAELPFFMALPFAAPPGLPPDRAAALRDAFMAMCHDRTFIQEAEALGFDLSPIDGAEVTRLIARSAATPKPIIERYNALLASRRN